MTYTSGPEQRRRKEEYSSDNFVNGFDLHLELGNMDATAFVQIAFGFFAELESIAGPKIDQKMNSSTPSRWS